MNMKLGKRFPVILCAGLLVALRLSRAQSQLASADFQNLVHVPGPAPIPNTSITQAPALAFFSGHIGLACQRQTPGDGSLYLIKSAFRHPLAVTLNFCPLETFTDLPALAIARQAGDVVIGWPAGWSACVLEETIDLNSASWRESSQQPVCQGGCYAVTVSLGSGNKFYRLGKIACGPQ
jgi:hypothetical protein